MKAAKIITFIAFVLNSAFTIFSVFIFLNIKRLFQELEAQISFPWTISILLVFAILSLIYWFYLRNKEKKGETVKFALWLSIALLLIPWLFLFPIVIISIVKPLYDLTGSL